MGRDTRTKIELYLSKEDIVALKEVKYSFSSNNLFVNNLVRALVCLTEDHEANR